MKPRLVALMNIFNEAEFIEMSIRSFIDCVDAVIVADGAYKDFPSPSDYSDDGTREIAESAQSPKIQWLAGPFRKTEVEKRNFLLKQTQPDDIVFIVDGDETCEGNLEEAFGFVRQMQENVGMVPFMDEVRGGKAYARLPNHPRFYNKISGLHYTRNHYTLCDEQGREVSVYSSLYRQAVVPSLLIRHRTDLRNAVRIEAKEAFYRTMNEG